MNNSIRRKITRSNRKLLRPTRIAIFTCSVFFVLSLMLSNFFALSVLSSFIQQLNRSDYIISFKDSADYSDVYSYEKVEEIIEHGLDGVDGSFIFLTKNLFLKNHSDNKNTYNLTVYMSPENEKYSPFDLLRGNLPQNDDEIVIPYYMEKQLGIKIGDEIELNRLTDGDNMKFKVSGTSYSKQNDFVYDGCFISRNKFNEISDLENKKSPISTIALYTDGRKLSQNQINNIESKFDNKLYRVAASEELVRDQMSKYFGGGINPVRLVALVFVSLAIGVGCMVISNTFRVLIARQKKTIALLRTAGATKKQIYSMVLQDAFSLGLGSSFFGALIPLIIVKLAEITKLRVGDILVINVVDWKFLIYPTIVLTIVTLLSTISSAKIATRVSPLEALRPNEDIETVREKKRKGIFYKLLLILGLIGMVVALFISNELAKQISRNNNVDISSQLMKNILFAILCSFAVFITIVFSARNWLVNILKLFFKLINKKYSNLYLASANILRNPRRTSITAAALMIGIIMVTTILTGASSANSTFDKIISERYPIDLEFVNADGEKDNFIREFQNNKELFSEVEEIPEYIVSISGLRERVLSREEIDSIANFNILAIDSDKLFQLTNLKIPPISENELYAGPELLEYLQKRLTSDFNDGDMLIFEFSDGTLHQFKLRVDNALRHISNSRNFNVLISSDYSNSLGLETNLNKVIIKVADKAKINDLIKFMSSNISKVSAGMSGAYMEKTMIKKSIDSSMYVLFALIATTILIAIIGIANTLILSVIERRKETAMLRVIGMTKSQIKTGLSYEALLISLISISVGIIIGVAFGFYGIHIILHSVIGKSITFTTNFLGILILLIIGVVAALISSIAPSKESLKTSPIEALGNE